MFANSFRIHPVPMALIAGFAIVVFVNGLMMWLAISSFSGLYSDHARNIGIAYNRVIAEQRSRDALGWGVDVSWQPERHYLVLALRNAAGKPIENAVVFVELVRPAEKHAPIGVKLSGLGAGRFGAMVKLPLRGNWDADISVEANDQRYVITKRVFLQ